MINHDNYKELFHSIEPDPSIVRNLKVHVKNKHSRPRVRWIMALVTCFVLLLLIINPLINRNVSAPETDYDPSDNSSTKELVTIPSIELPKQSNVAMDMIGLVVYQGRIYTQSDTTISPEAVVAIIGDKIGTTKGNIDEWSEQKDYAVELASTIGMQDVYSVKGYDIEFRIMSYNQWEDGTIYTSLYDNNNGITLNNGGDWFDHLKFKDNLKSVAWLNWEDWYYSNPVEAKSIDISPVVLAFINALYDAKPFYDNDIVIRDMFFGKSVRDTNPNIKMLYLTLEDGTVTRLWIHKDGYVRSHVHAFFQIDKAIMEELWLSLE